MLKANESMKTIQTPQQENANAYTMSSHISQHGIPAQMEINEVVSLLSFYLRKFNFLSVAPFIYELITITLLAVLKVHWPPCLKIIPCKLLLCHYIKYIRKSFLLLFMTYVHRLRDILNSTKQNLFNSRYNNFNVVLCTLCKTIHFEFKPLAEEFHCEVTQAMM